MEIGDSFKKLKNLIGGDPASNEKKSKDARLKEVDRFERDLMVRIPTEYKEFLLRGVEKDPFLNTCDVLSQRDGSKSLYSFTIRKFLDIRSGEKDDLLYNFNKFHTITPIPNLLPIAFDKFRNIMAISLITGEIFFWDYLAKIDERLADPRLIKADKLYYVAPSFDTFYDSLYRKNRFN